MYFGSAAQRTLVIGGVAIVAAVGLIAWTHRSTPAAAPAYVPGTAVDYAQPVGNPGAPPVVYSASPFGSSLVPEAPPSEPVTAEPETAYGYETRSYRRRGSADRIAEPRTRVFVKKRPLKHSLEIVGGSAAGGALIGGLAGGGKGAGIGALVGGAGGLVYDRLTHKKKVVVTE
ncbi:MAG: hypothetical protein C5B51_07910 [Terriglobia bacterium]|nr:MAG: hypothetical protein C5B51_07910 [Terriglobia bacterium]